MTAAPRTTITNPPHHATQEFTNPLRHHATTPPRLALRRHSHLTTHGSRLTALRCTTRTMHHVHHDTTATPKKSWASLCHLLRWRSVWRPTPEPAPRPTTEQNISYIFLPSCVRHHCAPQVERHEPRLGVFGDLTGAARPPLTDNINRRCHGCRGALCVRISGRKRRGAR